MDKSVIEELYLKVFDNKGNVKVCGRECCKNLIKAMNNITDVDVGDPETGMMKTEILKMSINRT